MANRHTAEGVCQCPMLILQKKWVVQANCWAVHLGALDQSRRPVMAETHRTLIN